jgi:hypothetical protein
MDMLTRVIVASVTLVPLIAPSTGYGQVQRRVPDATSNAREMGRGHVNRRVPDETQVRSGGRVIGRDPDPFIRGQLQRLDSLGFK